MIDKDRTVTVLLLSVDPIQGNINLRNLDKLRCKLLAPPGFVLQCGACVQLAVPFAFLSDDNHTNATSIGISGNQVTNTAESTRSKVNSVSSGVRVCLAPMNGYGEALVTKRLCKGSLNPSRIRT